MKMELRATCAEVMRAVEALQAFARAQNLPESVVFGLALALEECGSNVVNHACAKNADQKFAVTFERRGDEVLIELRDSGPPFDPTAVSCPDLPALDDAPPGGWGIQLARKYTDRITYRRQGPENVLLLARSIRTADPANRAI
jgi:serine/threonine-protein kinase RsbW